MRVLNLERAEIVLLPESAFRETDRDVIAPRAKVFAPVADGMTAAELEAVIRALALLRWGAKLQASSNTENPA